MLASTLATAQSAWSLTPPSVEVGTIERLDNFASRHVDTRPIDVWLPPGYSPAKRYAVLYMQDGQMLFDATQTWNKSAWNVHRTLARLMQEGKVRDTIVVAVPNNGKYRYSEYFPEKYLVLAPTAVREEYVRRAQWNKTLGDAYLRFMVEELKPAIDRKYSTLPDAANTFVMGSSMGGMISLYALCEYPQVFGGAAGLSTHWVGRPGAWGPPEKLQNASLPLAAFTYLRAHLPKPGTHRIYLDHGTTGLDAIYGTHQIFVDEIFREAGYKQAQWQSRVFEGTGHSEADWAARLDIPLTFLLAPR
jgi:enterochelin esterase-like enzyme